MTSKTVSVVIPVYNAEPFLQETIQSILEQTFTEFELLFVDDCSTDNSVAIMRSFNDPRIRIFQNKNNHGPAYTQNVGFRHAKGKYIALLGADDIAIADRLAVQVTYLESHPECGLLCTSFYTFTDNSRYPTGIFHVPNPFIFPWCMLLSNPIGASTVMVRSSVLQQVGYFDESIPYGEDMELWGRIATFYKIDQLDFPLVKRRIHSSSLTQKMEISSKNHWESLVTKKKLALLAHIDITEQIAGVLIGLYQDITPRVAEEACHVMEQLATNFGASLGDNTVFRKYFYPILLEDLWRIAWKNPNARLPALKVALKLGFRYSPTSFVSYQFSRFCGRLVLPAKI